MECETFYFVSESDFSSSTMSKFGIDPITQHVSFKIFWWCVWPFCYKFSCQNVTLNRFYLITWLEHLRFFHYDFVFLTVFQAAVQEASLCNKHTLVNLWKIESTFSIIWWLWVKLNQVGKSQQVKFLSSQGSILMIMTKNS